MMQLLAIKPQDLVMAQLYPNEEAVLQDALRHLLQYRPKLRLDFAVYLYQHDEDVTLAKVAALAGVSFEQMKDILSERGVILRLGPTSMADALAEIETMNRIIQ
jgi:predicted HTH domain antitoxin